MGYLSQELFEVLGGNMNVRTDTNKYFHSLKNN